jgi:sugar phosphate isomerase/epimerase
MQNTPPSIESAQATPATSSRRDFLRRGALLAVGSNYLAGQRACAIEPIARNGAANFKLSLAAYSYRSLLSGDEPAMSLAEFIDDCAKMGLEGTELTSYYFPPEFDDAYLHQLRAHAFRLGLDVSGTAVANDFCLPDPARRAAEIAHVKRWVDHAATMSAGVIRIFSGGVSAGQTEEEAVGLAVAGIEEACEYAGSRGVFLALENHGGLTATADGLLEIVRRVESPWFGVNLDTGNFKSADIYGDLARVAPYALNVQVKVVIRPNGGSAEPTDFGRLGKILSAAAYRGYVVLEYEEAEDPRVACPRFVDQLRSALRSV